MRRPALLAALALALAACAPTGPPSDLDDVCRIFAERPDWLSGAARAHLRWGVPPPVQLAIVHQESRFRRDARPPRPTALGFLPLPRRSSAYGFGQVQDGTWEEYREDTGRPQASRTRFDDVADFIGWYRDRLLGERYGIDTPDVYHLYLAYHEGPTGYRQQSWAEKPWLQEAARRVEARAERYAAQYGTCGR